MLTTLTDAIIVLLCRWLVSNLPSGGLRFWKCSCSGTTELWQVTVIGQVMVDLRYRWFPTGALRNIRPLQSGVSLGPHWPVQACKGYWCGCFDKDLLLERGNAMTWSVRLTFKGRGRPAARIRRCDSAIFRAGFISRDVRIPRVFAVVRRWRVNKSTAYFPEHHSLRVAVGGWPPT